MRRFRFRLRTGGLEAALRIGGVLLAAGLRWAAGALVDRLRNPAARAQARAARSQAAVRGLAAQLGALKGAFVKAGQFAAVRHDLLPESTSAPLVALQDRVPPLPFEEIRAVVEAELGEPLASVFSRFDPEPLGAASVAQVHRAVLAEGPGGPRREVAVKVQYPWLEASLPADLALLRRGVRWGERFGGRRLPDAERFFAEFESGLEEELDFLREAAVAAQIAANLADDPQIVVPRVVEDRTTRRVLTMAFHDAVRVDDTDELDRLGVDRAAVLEVLARAYAKQVFVDGLFHADPHPGNLFVLRPEPGQEGRPRVLFVDFGLSKRLDPELRREMRLGIYAVLQQDLDGFVARMDGMGMIAAGARPDVRSAVAQMFERIAERSGPGGAGALGIGGSQILGLKDEAKALLQETPGLQLPNDLLLYAKTLSYLFALGEQLAPDVDLMKLSLPYVLRFLAER